MKKFKICYEEVLSGVAIVEAESVEDAIKKFNECEVVEEWTDNSYIKCISREDVEEYND